MQNRSFASVALIGLLVFLWKIAEVLHEMQDWEPLNPHTAGDVVVALCFGLAAIGAAAGIDLKGLLADALSGFGLFKSQP